jgi:hypothetical protein
MEKDFVIKHLQFYGIPCYDITYHNTVIQIICGAEFFGCLAQGFENFLAKA